MAYEMGDCLASKFETEYPDLDKLWLDIKSTDAIKRKKARDFLEREMRKAKEEFTAAHGDTAPLILAEADPTK